MTDTWREVIMPNLQGVFVMATKVVIYPVIPFSHLLNKKLISSNTGQLAR